MVLKVNDGVVTGFYGLENFLQSYSAIRHNATEFAKEPPRTTTIQEGLLYVGRREMGILHPESSLSVVGSEDATTCHIMFLRHLQTGIVGCAHLDSPNTEELDSLIEKVSEAVFKKIPDVMDSSRYKFVIDIIGGYTDDRGISEELSCGILTHLVSIPDFEFHLGMCCIGYFNTKIKKGIPHPIVYGAAYSLKNQCLYPARFPDHGPEELLRHLRMSFGSGTRAKLKNLYVNDTFIIEPFHYAGPEPSVIRYWLNSPPKLILEQMSTSPDVEPPEFVDGIKAAFRYLMENPNPQDTFKENKPRIYRFHKTKLKWEKFS